MIAEILLVLAGHSSSLFPTDHTILPAFRPLLHPGEAECLESLSRIAWRYRKVKAICATLSQSRSRYVCALCAALNRILKDEYENLVIETEAKILCRDPELVGRETFVPLSAIRAVFSEWDSPLAALESLMNQLESQERWQPGPLIDMLLARSRTGVHRISDIISRLSTAVQRVWRSQLIAFLVHGSLSSFEPLASEDYTLLDGSTPSCVSPQTKESIAYVGRALATVKAKKWQKQFPREQTFEHATLLETVLPEDPYEFDSVISQIRTNVSDWLWLNVLTRKDVDDAVMSLANYFLLRNGEFSLALIREIERLKTSRLTTRSGAPSVIREQDLNLALLRASLGTSAQHDSSLLNLRFQLPSGPSRPLLPSLNNTNLRALSSSLASNPPEATSFDDLLLGTSLVLSYGVSWPLDLFLHPSDLQIYAALFNYLSSLRKTHTGLHTCWTSLSNSQRARRRWTGLGEGGTAEDLEVRKELLRCGWGVVRDMGWFLDSLLGYVMVDVVDVEFRRLKALLNNSGRQRSESLGKSKSHPQMPSIAADGSSSLDFTTLRNIHSTYLERLVTGCLLSNPALTANIRAIFEVCERFAAQVERWGGDVLPALLFEGSLAAGGEDGVGAMVKERRGIVAEINEALHILFDNFYEQLSLSTSRQPFTATGDASKSILMNSTFANASTFQRTSIRQRAAKGYEGDGEVRRHVERLLLRLDFNGAFSKPRTYHHRGGDDILTEADLL
ncbi:Spc98 family-domain-containing protein [Hygrophoropsis aurantiaca]|uniref:Spc98 family-domain-containing protein n=1 Tax=Hygrophoropsis aurantiaca TaxID=72124 RepID=A0ACB8AVQ1_9AGAM|nr:Spc98 family-domain-containing protein [Hygrophoropsis aurantiaca]